MNELAEYALCTQGGLLSDFLNEVKVAAQATKNEGAALRNEKARILFLMRAVYFLGIQRDGEAYRFGAVCTAGEVLRREDQSHARKNVERPGSC